MANAVQILDKIERNCKQLGLSTSRTSSSVLVAEGMTITYSAAVIQAPMGGIDGSVTPFLGLGIANPGKISMDLAGAISTIATAEKLKVLHVVSGMANSILITNGAAVLAELQGSVDLLGMGE